MPRQKTITTYALNELTGTPKARALQWVAEGQIDHEWWDSVYEDAKNIGLKITSFDLDRNRHAKGEILTSAPEVAETILSNHGKDCETYKTAKSYLNSLTDIGDRPHSDTAEEVLFGSKEDEEIDAWDEKRDELDDEFLKSLLEDYSIMLQQEYEYLSSEEVLTETAEANDYQFDETGRIV